MTRTRFLLPAALLAASALTLAGCATAAEQAGSTDGGGDRLQVVASTNVYGQIAQEIGGDLVEVTSIVASSSQDPHSFEPSAGDQLAVSRADLVIENGGGYDAFIDALIESSGVDAPVVTAVEHSHDWPENAGHEGEHADETAAPGDSAAPVDDHADGEKHADDEHGHAEGEHGHDEHGHVEGFNEHVWYDPHTIEHVAESISKELAALRPGDAKTFETNLTGFVDSIAELETKLGELEAKDAGAAVFVTEPVPVYLLAAAGLEDVTPDAFSEAVEEGQDVPAATLAESLGLLESAEVRVVITNVQTAGAETAQVVDEAERRGIPVIGFAETLPEGQTYLSWMDANIASLADALQK